MDKKKKEETPILICNRANVRSKWRYHETIKRDYEIAKRYIPLIIYDAEERVNRGEKN